MKSRRKIGVRLKNQRDSAKNKVRCGANCSINDYEGKKCVCTQSQDHILKANRVCSDRVFHVVSSHHIRRHGRHIFLLLPTVTADFIVCWFTLPEPGTQKAKRLSLCMCSLKGTVHTKMSILSSFYHPEGIPIQNFRMQQKNHFLN